MAEHISGKDVIRLINLYDDPLFSEVAQLTLENVTDFDADETLTVAQECIVSEMRKLYQHDNESIASWWTRCP